MTVHFNCRGHAMKLCFTGLSDPGLVRSVNQDAYYIDPEERFFILADGMGGHAGGEEASRIATKEISSHLAANWDSLQSSEDLLSAALLQANQAIVQDQHDFPERSDMGTTAVVVIFRPDEQPWCAHIGDSRLYRLRDSHLQQITDDHTWVARAIKVGEIKPEEARTHPWRHVLSRCLGRDDLYQVEVQQLNVEVGDRLLLCSDGLTEELVDEDITTCFQPSPVLQKPIEEQIESTAISLIEAAKEHGGHDNITVVIIALEAV